jgi:predicted RND superfamily exporter protein
VNNNKSLIETFNIDPNTLIPRTDQDVRALYDYLYEGTGNGNININLDVSSDMDQGQFDQMKLMMESFETIGGEIKSVLYKEDGQYTATLIRIYIDPIFRSVDGSVEDELVLLKQQFNDDVSNYGTATATVTGSNIVSLTITNSLTDSQILSTAISILLAALVLILVYRNAYLGIIALIPVGFSIIWILGTMFYIGYSLNALTITVTSITIGIGIDYAIHATERFRLIVDKTGDIVRAVTETISHTGGALLIAALTTVLGFGVLVFAPIPPQQQFGLILAVTITYSFLTSIFILPLILYHWAMRRKKRKGYVISPLENPNNRP